jgi:FkbM family methyltransferase
MVKAIIKAIKTVAYWSPAIRVSKALGLARVLRRLYYGFTKPAGGVLRANLAGIPVQFLVPTPEALRLVESVLHGERHVWEALYHALQSGGTVYDIGSSVGAYTVFLSKVVGERGQVIAFEPEGWSYLRLQENLALNGITNARCFQKALGDWSGEGKLYQGEHKAASTLVHRDATNTRYEVVEVVEGDRFIEAHNLPVPKAVKIDVQGYEYAVLQGLRHTLAQPDCELLCCEVHPKLLPPKVTPEDVYSLVKSLGFSRLDIYPRGDDSHAICRKS